MPKRTTDKKLLKRLAKEAPEVLEAEVGFDLLVEKVLTTEPKPEQPKSAHKTNR